jgi:hypothetical protein
LVEGGVVAGVGGFVAEDAAGDDERGAARRIFPLSGFARAKCGCAEPCGRVSSSFCRR